MRSWIPSKFSCDGPALPFPHRAAAAEANTTCSTPSLRRATLNVSSMPTYLAQAQEVQQGLLPEALFDALLRLSLPAASGAASRERTDTPSQVQPVSHVSAVLLRRCAAPYTLQSPTAAVPHCCSLVLLQLPAAAASCCCSLPRFHPPAAATSRIPNCQSHTVHPVTACSAATVQPGQEQVRVTLLLTLPRHMVYQQPRESDPSVYTTVDGPPGTAEWYDA
jgi:hypothetical protein